jgi:hypothetical protein
MSSMKLLFILFMALYTPTVDAFFDEVYQSMATRFISQISSLFLHSYTIIIMDILVYVNSAIIICMLTSSRMKNWNYGLLDEIYCWYMRTARHAQLWRTPRDPPTTFFLEVQAGKSGPDVPRHCIRKSRSPPRPQGGPCSILGFGHRADAAVRESVEAAPPQDRLVAEATAMARGESQVTRRALAAAEEAPMD